MKYLRKLLKMPLQAVPNNIAIILLIVALIGFIDAGYLTLEHFQGRIPPCSVTGGCEVVLTSSYSVILGIPVSLTGVIYYLFILAGTFAYLESKNLKILKCVLLITFFGLLASLWFTFVQVFILNSYCAYCLGSALISLTLFSISMKVLNKYQIKENN